MGNHSRSSARQEEMEARIKRNPNAFRSKFDLTGADIRRRCFCKKSKCVKKYCECFSAGVKCNDGCRCEDCANEKTNERQPEILKRRRPGPKDRIKASAAAMAPGREALPVPAAKKPLLFDLRLEELATLNAADAEESKWPPGKLTPIQ